jgi:hypothetical protein
MSPKINGHPRSTLLLRTLELLENRPEIANLAVISQDTGLPRDWLAAIIAKPETSPSVDRIEQLYEYLSGNKLEIR